MTTLHDLMTLVQQNPHFIAGSARIECGVLLYSAEDFVHADLEVTILADGRIRERWLNEEGIDTVYSPDEYRAFITCDFENMPEGMSFYDWERLTQNGQLAAL